MKADDDEPKGVEIDESNPENWMSILKKKRKAAWSPLKKKQIYVEASAKEMAIFLRLFISGADGEPERLHDDE